MSYNKNLLMFIVVIAVTTLLSLPCNASIPVVKLVDKNAEVKNLNASVIINAPPQIVWDVITDYSHFTSFMPGIKQCLILQNSGNAKTLKIKLDVSALMGAFIYQANVVENSSTKTIVMTRTAGDFNYLQLTYSLKPLDNDTKTLVNYCLKINHGKNIPNTFANKALTNNASKTLTAVDQISVKKKSNKSLASK